MKSNEVLLSRVIIKENNTQEYDFRFVFYGKKLMNIFINDTEYSLDNFIKYYKNTFCKTHQDAINVVFEAVNKI